MVTRSSPGASTCGHSWLSVPRAPPPHQDYRRKCDAAERAYEAKREKEVAMMQCRELEFLMLDPSSLCAARKSEPSLKGKQTAIMRKYPNADV
ncbi:hypothetical protein Tco_0895076 [Tanacetum coccineum]|uniref:Uncharacterized protein n=1 Tax=Tanacetum coccineum TaxID=301880 RepID=A0ABQ5CJU8_9ASTR